MEIKALQPLMNISTTAKKLYDRTRFAEQLLAEHLLVEHLSMPASIKLKIIKFNRSKLMFDFYAIFNRS